MVKNEHRQLICREIGNECDFLIRAGTDEKLLQLASNHLCGVHQICYLNSDHADKINNSIRSIWCQEQQCGDIPQWGWG
jgi:predicted small metal-binding protein